MMKHCWTRLTVVGLCMLVAACAADKPSPLYKGSSTPVSLSKDSAQVGGISSISSKKRSSSPQPTAESRQDSYGSPQASAVNNYGSPQASAVDNYGSPQAPAVDSYGSPQAPAVDSYGSPQAPVVDSYGSPQGPVVSNDIDKSSTGQVGTQGYYYYYYPVASTYGGGAAAGSGSGYGGASGASQKTGNSQFSGGSSEGFGNIGLPAAFIIGSIIIGVIIAIVMSANVAFTGRSLSETLGSLDTSSFDLDNLALKVYEGIQAYNSML